MVVIFSSNEKGAMIQMAVKVTEVLQKIGIEAKCFMPSIAKGVIPDEIKTSIIRYEKLKTVNPFSSVARKVAKQILALKPNLVWYIDNGIFSSQVGINLSGHVKQALIMHDAGTSHSSFNNSIRQQLKCFAQKKTSEICNNKIDWIITCSPSSKRVYSQLYPFHKDKVYMLTLGPHMPEGISECPPEVENLSDYNMFFGRIDKYKGLDVLFRTYARWSGDRKLVIAGSGQLQPEEAQMAVNDPRIILINRFIKDEEMPYLFANSRSVILPYKDATQSGILPIAYLCGKPVISSDVIGIAQFVEEGKTGYVCSDEDSYVEAYERLEDDTLLRKMSTNARRYYVENLKWDVNIKKMLNAFKVYNSLVSK